MTSLTTSKLDDAARDLQTIDEFSNSNSPTTTTRKGDSVATRAGLTAQVNDLIAGAAASASAAAGSAGAAAGSAAASAGSAAGALASKNAADASASQAALLAGVTGVYASNAAMQAALAAIGAGANVMVLADEAKQGQTSIYQKSAGAMVYQGLVQTSPGTSGGLGDVGPENCIWIFPGDSTTEQAGGAGYLFDTITSEYRGVGGPLQNIVGTINFGGSGHKLADWVNGAAGALPVYSTANSGPGQNDYFGHKAAGAQTLATELLWRANLAPGLRVVWAICYGINDCILDNTVGGLSQQGISDYIAGYLRQAMRRIQSVFPRDKILLRVPNPMTARPYDSAAGFPSAAAYPTFGSDATADAALVEKWNQGIRGGYLAVRNEFSGTALYDKWDLVYGPSSTAKTVAQLPFMQNLVHPGAAGYRQEAHQLLSFMAPNARVKRRQLNGRHAWAVAYAAIEGVQPWEKWPAYLDNNYKYQFLVEGVLSARGANFLDVSLKVSDLVKMSAGRGIYVQVGEAAAQYFSAYNPVDQGATDSTVRFLSVLPSAAMQAAAVGLPVRIYVDAVPVYVAGDSYVHGIATAAKEYYECSVSAAGNGFIDITLSGKIGRPSTKFIQSLKGGRLVFGGGLNTSVSLSTATLSRNGTTAQRVFRALIAGDQSAYAGKPVALVFDDDKSSPKSMEYLPTKYAAMPHSQNSRCFLFCDQALLDGATLSVSMVSPVAVAVTVDVYKIEYPSRTLLGTINIAANTGAGNLAAGNPASVNAGAGFEFVLTSATADAAPVIGKLTPI